MRMASEARDRRLGPLSRLRLSLHLRMCSWCSRAARQIALIARANAQAPAADQPLPAAARERIADAVRDLK
jgi:hypothetical protein